MNKNLVSYFAWIVSIVATLGSLYYSEVRGFIPCKLCWIQRIFMYPLVLIIFLGIFNKDKNFPRYVLPLSLIGGSISLYHYLLQLGVITVSSTCGLGGACASRFINYFGFVTIPFLALTAFIFISASMIYLLKTSDNASQA